MSSTKSFSMDFVDLNHYQVTIPNGYDDITSMKIEMSIANPSQNETYIWTMTDSDGSTQLSVTGLTSPYTISATLTSSIQLPYTLDVYLGVYYPSTTYISGGTLTIIYGDRTPIMCTIDGVSYNVCIAVYTSVIITAESTGKYYITADGYLKTFFVAYDGNPDDKIEVDLTSLYTRNLILRAINEQGITVYALSEGEKLYQA